MTTEGTDEVWSDILVPGYPPRCKRCPRRTDSLTRTQRDGGSFVLFVTQRALEARADEWNYSWV